METLSIRTKIERELVEAGWCLCDDGLGFAFLYRDHACTVLLDGVEMRDDGTTWVSVGVSTMFTEVPTEEQSTLIARCAGRYSIGSFSWESSDTEEVRLRFVFVYEVRLGVMHTLFKSRAALPFTEVVDLYTGANTVPHAHALPLFMLDRAIASVH